MDGSVKLDLTNWVSQFCPISTTEQTATTIHLAQDYGVVTSETEGCAYQPYGGNVLNFRGEVIVTRKSTLWQRVKKLIRRLMGR